MKSKILLFIVIIFAIAIISGIRCLGPLTPPGMIDKAKHDAAKAKMAPIKSAINTFFKNTGQYPESLEELLRDPGLSGWAGPYLKEKYLYDPWNNPFIYEPDPNDPNGYIIKSYGKDGKPGGEGYDSDIYSD